MSLLHPTSFGHIKKGDPTNRRDWRKALLMMVCVTGSCIRSDETRRDPVGTGQAQVLVHSHTFTTSWADPLNTLDEHMMIILIIIIIKTSIQCWDKDLNPKSLRSIVLQSRIGVELVRVISEPPVVAHWVGVGVGVEQHGCGHKEFYSSC